MESGCRLQRQKQWLAADENSLFSPSFQTNFGEFSAPNPLFRAALQETFGHDHILPIESLKLDASYWMQALHKEPARVFLSSGTTQIDRSVSPFSSEGLNLYKSSSSKAFWAVMSHYFQNPRAVSGWSMIPPPADWPSSSLAQMVAWIGEEADLRYVSEDITSPLTPIWLFATAFHLVQFADSGRRCLLPEGSVIIETGGTKGKSRSVDRSELYQLIQESFGVLPDFIVSEYGMCELASQAYDFVSAPRQGDTPLAERVFRFPSWVGLRVVNTKGESLTQGIGSLLLDDSMRIDLPCPIRTEDIAHLRSDGSFQLFGRVPYTPLKGCSLLAEEIQTAVAPPASVPSSPPEFWNRSGATNLMAKAIKLSELWESWLDHPLTRDYFASELGSLILADQVLIDLRASLPTQSHEWVNAALRAVDGRVDLAKRWLIIPPRTHSIAPFQALSLAGLLGLKVILRASAHQKIPAWWASHMREVIDLSWLPADFRLGEGISPQIDALMVFGSTDTVARLRRDCPWPIKGFGTHLTASLVAAHEAATAAPLIWKDALSLGQKGCMSSRILFISDWDAKDSKEILRVMEEASLSFQDALSLPQSLALVHASYQWRRENRGVISRKQPGSPLLILESWSPDRSLESYLCDRPWSLPLIGVSRQQGVDFAEWITQQKSLRLLCVSQSQLDHFDFAKAALTICLHGRANIPIWNGLHEGRPLFSWTET